MANVFTESRPTNSRSNPDHSVNDAGALLRKALAAGAPSEVMHVLRDLDAPSMAEALESAGFKIDRDLAPWNRAGLFDQVKQDLAMALAIRGDGHSLAAHNRHRAPARHGRSGSAEFESSEQTAETSASQAIRAVFGADRVSVSVLGDRSHLQRDVLLMLAGQAMQRDLLGFGFDGIPGKYELPLRLADVFELHVEAAAAVATEQALLGLHAWAQGNRLTDLGDWLPDGVHRLLSSPLTLTAAEALLHAIDSGSVARHAKEKGSLTIERLLADRGLDVQEPTVEQQASDLGLVIHAPDRERGRYFGTVVAKDHRAILIKSTRQTGILLAYGDLPTGMDQPLLGSTIRLSFHGGTMRAGWEGQANTNLLAR